MILRIAFIEKVVTRLARRSRKQSSAIITPYPISGCLAGNISGEVLRYIFCADGTITRAIISLDKKPSEGVKVTIDLFDESGGTSKSFIAMKKVSIIEPEAPVFSGDKMVVSAEVINPERDKISELWLGLLWKPHVKDTHVKSFLIDDLEKQEDDLLQE